MTSQCRYFSTAIAAGMLLLGSIAFIANAAATETAGQKFERVIKKAGNSINKGVEKAGNGFLKGSDKAAKNVGKTAEKADRKIQKKIGNGKSEQSADTQQ